MTTRIDNGWARRVLARLARVGAALLVSFWLAAFMPSGGGYPEIAWADTPQSVGVASAEAPSEAAQSSDDAAAAEEEIEDDETPMAGELESGKTFRGLGGYIQWALAAAVLAVLAFYGYSTLRVNRSIESMKRRFR